MRVRMKWLTTLARRFDNWMNGRPRNYTPPACVDCGGPCDPDADLVADPAGLVYRCLACRTSGVTVIDDPDGSS